MKQLSLPVLFVGLVPLFGCTSSEEPTQSEVHLRKLSIVYGQYLAKHKGKGPAGESDLKAFVKTMGKEKLSDLGISDPAAIFISPRDDQPYVILYNLKPTPPGGPGSQTGSVVAYEKQGQNDTRYVAFVTTEVKEVSEDAFRKLVPDAR